MTQRFLGGRQSELRARAVMLWRIARQRAHLEQEWCVGRARRYALCAKAALCVVLGRVRTDDPDWSHGVLDVCATWSRSGAGPDGSWASWGLVAVPSGFLRRWHVHEYETGT